MHNWAFPIVYFVLNTPISISIHCDYLLLLILAACPDVLLHCLLCLRFLDYWFDFTARFIFFSLFISVQGRRFSVTRSVVSWGSVPFFSIFVLNFVSSLIYVFDVFVVIPSAFSRVFPSGFFLSKWFFPASFSLECSLASNRYPSPYPWSRRTSNFMVVVFFLSTIVYFSDVTLNPLLNALVTLKIFTLKSSMYAISVHVTGYNLPSIFWYPFQSPIGKPVIIFLFPVFSTVFTSRRFVIFFRLFTICDVDPESATKICSISLSIVFFHASVSSPK